MDAGIFIPRADRPHTVVEGPDFHLGTGTWRVALVLDGHCMSRMTSRSAFILANLLLREATRAGLRPDQDDGERLDQAAIGTVGVSKGRVVLKRADMGQLASYSPEEACELANNVAACAREAEGALFHEAQKKQDRKIKTRRVLFNGECLPVLDSLKQLERL